MLFLATCQRCAPLVRPVHALPRAAAAAHSTRTAPLHPGSRPKGGPKGSVQTQAFVDIDFLLGALTTHAKQKYGPSFASSCVLDAGPLKPFLEGAAAAALGGECEVTISHVFAYGSLPRKPADVSARNWDAVRVCGEEDWALRRFNPPVAPQATTTTASATSSATVAAVGPTRGPHPFPSIALAVDMLHACAIRGGVDDGVPVGGGGSGGALTHLVIGLVGSPAYLPALVRAAQHGRLTALASTDAMLREIVAPLREELKGVTVPLSIDALLPQMVVPLGTFRATAQPLASLAATLHAAIAAGVGMNTLVNGTELAGVVAGSKLLKELRRASVTLKVVCEKHPDLFTLATEPDQRWTVIARSPRIAAVEAAVAPAPVVATPEPRLADAPPKSTAGASHSSDSGRSHRQAPPPSKPPSLWSSDRLGRLAQELENDALGALGSLVHDSPSPSSSRKVDNTSSRGKGGGRTHTSVDTVEMSAVAVEARAPEPAAAPEVVPAPAPEPAVTPSAPEPAVAPPATPVVVAPVTPTPRKGGKRAAARASTSASPTPAPAAPAVEPIAVAAAEADSPVVDAPAVVAHPTPKARKADPDPIRALLRLASLKAPLQFPPQTRISVASLRALLALPEGVTPEEAAALAPTRDIGRAAVIERLATVTAALEGRS